MMTSSSVEITSGLDGIDGVYRFHRSTPGSSGAAIADLLQDVAGRLRRMGHVEVHDVVVTPATRTRDESTVTVYYETVASLVDA